MKVLLINGSSKEGCTYTALSEVVRSLNEEGIETEIINLGPNAVRDCIGCGMCAKNGNARCIFDDDICNKISEKFKEVQALIVGSPVYYGQPNGALLSIIQRAFYSNGANISGKPAASIAVCRRGGATAVFESLNMPFQMMNMPIVTSQYWNIVYGRTPGDAAMDTEGLQTMRTLARNMAWLLKSTNGEKAPGRPTEEAWEAMHFIR